MNTTKRQHVSENLLFAPRPRRFFSIQASPAELEQWGVLDCYAFAQEDWVAEYIYAKLGHLGPNTYIVEIPNNDDIDWNNS